MTTTLAPCLSEDSDNCYWDALHMGNGTGTGFVMINGTQFDLVNEPEWNVIVTAVHYDCDDFTKAECQPYADYAEATPENIYETLKVEPKELAHTGIPNSMIPEVTGMAVVIILAGILLTKVLRRS